MDEPDTETSITGQWVVVGTWPGGRRNPLQIDNKKFVFESFWEAQDGANFIQELVMGSDFKIKDIMVEPAGNWIAEIMAMEARRGR